MNHFCETHNLDTKSANSVSRLHEDCSAWKTLDSGRTIVGWQKGKRDFISGQMAGNAPDATFLGRAPLSVFLKIAMTTLDD
jgi:hypothetical protein